MCSRFKLGFIKPTKILLSYLCLNELSVCLLLFNYFYSISIYNLKISTVPY